MVALAAGWLLYTQVWTGRRKTVPYTDLTPQLGTIEFTRKVTAVYHSRRPFKTLLDATMPGRAPGSRRTTGIATRSW
jgi:hypothetical protein